MLMDKERSMLNGVELTQQLWAEEVDTIRYLVNMSPLSVLVDMTPHEVCSSKKLALDQVLRKHWSSLTTFWTLMQ
jgi:hypothetical protein